MSSADALQFLGELLITGFEGKQLSEDTAAFLQQSRIGGVLLFEKNYENPKQLRDLICQIQECRSDLPLWISVDQEGGRVQRFKEPFTRIPKAQIIGKVDSPKLTFELGDMIAKELKAVGINLNFNPVADILTNTNNQVIGDRSFGDSEALVSRMVTAIVRGHIVAGVQPCVKHFPGHGGTLEDSHEQLPRVQTTLEELEELSFRPFVRTFKSRCNMVMTAHVVFDKIDPEYPATLSKKILRDILRSRLRYSRVIVSDDLEMKAIIDKFGLENGAFLALEAGCDILVVRSEAMARKVYSSLTQAIENSKLSPEIVLEAAKRCRNLKKEVLGTYEAPSEKDLDQKIGTPEHRALVEKFV